MIIMGLDIGSTTLSAVAIDAETHEERESITVKHHATLPTEHAWEHIQDPIRLVELGEDLLHALSCRHGKAAGIGLSGQMHGILYIDDQGKAASPFYTWQDRRAGLPETDGSLFIDKLSQAALSPIQEGYGFATHLWNLRHGCAPKDARWITTISGYMAMRLTAARTPPPLHPSEAASWGFYDLKKNCQERSELRALGVDVSMLPAIAGGNGIAGYTAEGVPVFCGLGDNQASFLGSVKDVDHDVLLNIGTGSQITRKLSHYIPGSACEIRPFLEKDYIAVGSGLCGGRAFALLERFIRSCAAMAGQKSDSVYERMADILKKGTDTDLKFNAAFCGTRHAPQQRASVSNLSPENFTAEDFVRAVPRGIVEELYDYFQEILHLSDTPIKKIYCAGNLIRLTPEILGIVEKVFRLPAVMAPAKEETAFGAALYAAQKTECAYYMREKVE